MAKEKKARKTEIAMGDRIKRDLERGRVGEKEQQIEGIGDC